MSVQVKPTLSENAGPTYAKLFDKLRQDLKSKISGHWELLTEFSEAYMMPAELWELYYR